MTDEQSKPVRSREEQVEALAKAIGPEKVFPLLNEEYQNEIRERAKRHIEEAEARGTAEQRRKDGEGNIPSAYVRPNDFYDDERDERFGPWTDIQRGDFTIPLYTHPVNVAALEDRVRELEEECERYREGYQEMETLRKFYATDERHLKVVALARDILASDGTPS